uniref:Uncharacterized protein n=1 Tax=Romanomermis culicivorax TaxID=13658 RepID=A0A915I1S3_ROMCU
TPTDPKTTPIKTIDRLTHFCLSFNFGAFIFKWNNDGQTKLNIVPVILPTKPINKAKCGTEMAMNNVKSTKHILAARAHSLMVPSKEKQEQVFFLSFLKN